jgi:4-carboxymuconolactone decarboxylase
VSTPPELGPDRLPLPAALTVDQQLALERITAGPRGKLIEPFIPLMRTPELMTRLQLVGEYLRFGSGLPGHLIELVILTVARRWNQDYEWGHHAPLARAAGLDEHVIAEIRDGRSPVSGPDDVLAVWQFVTELDEHHGVTDPTFDAALRHVGDTGVVELTATVGYYTTLAMTMNVARTPVPDDYERLPPRETS